MVAMYSQCHTPKKVGKNALNYTKISEQSYGIYQNCEWSTLHMGK